MTGTRAAYSLRSGLRKKISSIEGLIHYNLAEKISEYTLLSWYARKRNARNRGSEISVSRMGI